MQACQTYFCGMKLPMAAEMEGAKFGTSQWVLVEFWNSESFNKSNIVHAFKPQLCYHFSSNNRLTKNKLITNLYLLKGTKKFESILGNFDIFLNSRKVNVSRLPQSCWCRKEQCRRRNQRAATKLCRWTTSESSGEGSSSTACQATYWKKEIMIFTASTNYYNSSALSLL
jgi:hypothetical protein